MIPGSYKHILTRVPRSFRLLALLLALPVVCSHAQFNNGAIAGTLRDTTGAVIPDATVTIRNVNTGVTTTLKTNHDGAYEALALIPGTYSVEATGASVEALDAREATANAQRE